jgi:hypothetical protein
VPLNQADNAKSLKWGAGALVAGIVTAVCFGMAGESDVRNVAAVGALAVTAVLWRVACVYHARARGFSKWTGLWCGPVMLMYVSRVRTADTKAEPELPPGPS